MNNRKYIMFFVAIFVCLPYSLRGQSIPYSPRSKNAINNCISQLEQEFKIQGLNLGNKVFIRIFKESKDLEIWIEKGEIFEHFKTYKICNYSGGLGTKTREGDGKSPEGFYFVTPKQLNPMSSFHLSYNIGYPNLYERERGYTGSAIMVHGSCVSIGCYAMTNERIEEIWTIIVKAFENDQRFFRIHIFPFKFNDKNLIRNTDSTLDKFWLNLKEGYDYFEENHYPPDVGVRNGRYIFR